MRSILKTKTKTMKWPELKDRLYTGYVNRNPIYQREATAWGKAKKVSFIEGLLRDPSTMLLSPISIATFKTASQMDEQKGKDAITGEILDIRNAEGDHIVPYSKGGKTNFDNLQVISKYVNRVKGAN